MAIDNILIGTTPNDKTGDTLRNGAIKINSNFNELDTRTSTIISGSDQVSGSFVNKIGGDTLTGVLIISGALQISGSSEFGGNLVPKTARGATLGTFDKPFSEIFVSSGSLNIASDNPGDPVTSFSNVEGNILVSAGGMILVEPGNSFIAATGSFNYLVITGSINTSGSTTLSGSLDITNGITTVDYITFDTNPETISTAQGALSWNAAELTLDLIQNGTTLQLGQEQQYPVRNASGQTILDGTPCMVVGTAGASGLILIAPMDASIVTNSTKFLGVATETMLNGANGKVTEFGKVRGINTTSFNEFDTLWLDPNTIGGLTNVEPLESNMSMPMAFVISSAVNGTIFVRVNNLNTHEFVRTNEDSAISGRLTISGSLILQNPTVPTSISGSGTQNEIRTDSDYIYVCIAPNSWKRSLLSTW
jgi:hypothetical protein